MATKSDPEPVPATESAGGAEPSSAETCGQFPADEVLATHDKLGAKE